MTTVGKDLGVVGAITVIGLVACADSGTALSSRAASGPEVRLQALEPAVADVLRPAFNAHGWLHEGTPLTVQKRTILYAPDSTIDTCYVEEYVLLGDNSSVRSVTGEACTGVFEPTAVLAGAPSRPLRGEAFRAAHFTATLPWRLLDAETELRRLADTVVPTLNSHLGLEPQTMVHRLKAYYPATPAAEPTTHFFSEETGRHLGYLISHRSGPALVINDGTGPTTGDYLEPHRTTLRLAADGTAAYRRAAFAYRFPEPPTFLPLGGKD